jgi:hypothetical protein
MFTQRTPKQFRKKQSSAWALLHRNLVTSSTSRPPAPAPGTRPLGEGVTKSAVMESRKGLLLGMLAWRLKKPRFQLDRSAEWPPWPRITVAPDRRRWGSPQDAAAQLIFTLRLPQNGGGQRRREAGGYVNLSGERTTKEIGANTFIGLSSLRKRNNDSSGSRGDAAHRRDWDREIVFTRESIWCLESGQTCSKQEAF